MSKPDTRVVEPDATTAAMGTTTALSSKRMQHNHHLRSAKLGPNQVADMGNEEEAITLTKYNTLQAEVGPPLRSVSTETMQAVEPTPSDTSQNQVYPSQESQTIDTTKSVEKLDRQTNKLWTINQHQRQALTEQESSDGKVKTEIAKPDDEGRPRDDAEPFRIVWTDLAFEVELDVYDKLVNRAHGCLQVVRGLISRRCRRNREPTGDGRQVIDQPLACSRESISTQQTLASSSTLDSISERSVKQPVNAPTAAAAVDQDRIIDNNKAASSSRDCDKRVIFENLNGYINSGELTAILGPSGSGKTSLLNALCGRSQRNYRGRIQLMGGSLRGRRVQLSIIPQKDHLIENLSVRENLLYSSRLLNPESNFNHETNILRVVKMLNLSACFDSIVANISGGEYKRVSIGQELLRQPDILVLDEPTSGLDSLNCKRLIDSLNKLIGYSRDHRHLNRPPIAIVMTIHQPDVDVFHMFDHVYCMARGGLVIYDGHPRHAMHVIEAQTNLPVGGREGVGSKPEAPPERDAASTTSDNSGGQRAHRRDHHHHHYHQTMNPANLLIEIASEELYGRAPIESLARHQLEQFQLLQTSWEETGGGVRGRSSSVSQWRANLTRDQPAVQHAMTISDAKQGQSPRLLVPMINTTRSSDDYIELPKTIKPLSDLQRDKRLDAKSDHSGLFWYHTGVLTKRAFVSTLRDPLMTIIALLFHLFIPFVMYTVYSRRTGSVHGCPVSQRELDIVSLGSEMVLNKMEELQESMTTTLECSTMFFLTTYSFSMCSLSVAALAFPLNMHILLKEIRNGWYNLPCYVVAKTISNFPFEVLFPMISLVMIYAMLEMPSSSYEWRLWSIAMVMGLIAMISHTQGLIFGALCMNSVQTAIFLASAFSLPQILLSGFTARIRHMPWLLQKLSWFSQYHYSSDIINMIRFGFGICPCNSSDDEYLRTSQPEFKDLPNNLKPIFIYSLISNTPDPSTPLDPMQHNQASGNASSSTSSLTLDATERFELLKRMEANEVDLFARMADMTSRSFSFGRQITGCHSIRPQILITAGTPTDEHLPTMFACMFGLLIVVKILLFVTVRHKIGSRV